MATSLSIYRYDGYPTETSMRVYVELTVTYAAKYKIHFEVVDEYGDIVYSGFGTTLTMAAGESITEDDDLYKTFTGLTPGTDYGVVATLWNATENYELNVQDTLAFTTDSSGTVTIKYYDGNKTVNTVSSEGSITVKSASRSGWDFVGWATSTNTESVSYEAGDVIYATSGDKTVNLYAVYMKESEISFYYITSSTGALSSNTRTKIQYRVNTSKSAATEDWYNVITLPSFSTSNSTIATDDPDRTWSAAGWCTSSFAMEPDYAPGQQISSDRLGSFLYAVYSNGCSITYNSNGGSGSMSKQTGTAYYSASGDYTGVTFNLKDCTFTPPSGKTFAAWNVKADGTGASYTNTITTNYNVILYAIWGTGRPKDWSWTTTGISRGSSMAYTQSGTVITPKPLTATEWLNFIERVKAFATYVGVSLDSTYLYRATNGVSKGSPMTSTQANGARFLVNQLNPPTKVPASVSSGSVVTASFINGLKDSLNSID